MGKKLYLTFDTSLSDICEINSSFDRGVLRICYAGENRNKTFIDRKDLERCVSTLPYVPIVGNYIRSEEDFGGHDVEVITTLDGEIRMVNKTQPLGVVPADANIYFEKYTNENGEEREYLYTDVLLWKRQEAYKKIKEDGVVSHSMEITVKNGESIDGIYHIYDFEFTALCLLGSNVTPCFEDSALEVFTTSDFKAQFELMMEDLKESFNLATTSSEEKNISQDDTLMKGGEEDLKDDKQDVFAEEEVVDVEPVEEPVEEDAPVDPEEAPAESFEEEAPEEEPVDEPDEESIEEPQEEDFSLAGEIGSALFNVLWETDRIPSEDGDYTRYWMVDFDPDVNLVYFNDCADDWKLFGCSYSMNGDNVAIDFDSKKRMKYVITEFDEGSEDRVFNVYSFIYESLKDRIAECDSEIAALRAFKNEIETNEAISERNAIIAEFDDLTGIEEFAMVCDNMLEYGVDELREKFYAIRGKNITNPTSKKFSMNSGMPKFPVESNGVVEPTDSDAPYGGIVEKYRHES